MAALRRKIEVLSNIALIVCCVLFSIFLVKNFLISNKKEDTKQNTPPPTLVGKKISVSDLDWTKNQQTLLLILQKGCRFCDESAPFYQSLVKEFSNQSKTHLVVVMPHNNDESQQYLKDKAIEIPDIKQATPKSIGVAGTPTLMLIDNSGTVLEQWIGKLSAEQEGVVIARLKQ